MVFDLHWIVAAGLILAAVWDAKTAKIPNWLVLSLVVVFAAKWALDPATVSLWQIGFAGLIFAGGFGLFVAGAMGAGAIKLATATALFMPLDRLGMLGLAFVLAVILSMIVIGAVRGAIGSDDSAWACLRKRIIPMAVPIALTGLAGLFVL